MMNIWKERKGLLVKGVDHFDRTTVHMGTIKDAAAGLILIITSGGNTEIIEETNAYLISMSTNKEALDLLKKGD